MNLGRALLFFIFLISFAKADIKILGVGDILIHQPLRRQGLESPHGFASLWADLLPDLKSAHVTYGNLEGPMADRLAPQTAQYSFNFPSRLAKDLVESGFDIVSTANNHSLDRGLEGLIETIRSLEDAGLSYVGTRSDLNSSEGFYKIIDVSGVRTAWIACTDIVNISRSPHVADCGSDQEYLGNLIKEMKLKLNVDLVIVTPHWGEEKNLNPSERQKSLAQFFFRKGADLILGAHPHVLQPVDFFRMDDELGYRKNRLVFYSLGNFVSNQLYFGIPQKTSILAYSFFKKRDTFIEVSSFSAVPIVMSLAPFQVRRAHISSDEYKFVQSLNLISR